MSKAIPVPDKRILQDLYETQKLSTTKIAALYGVSDPVVLRWLRRYNIQPRPKSPGLANRGLQIPTKEDLENMIREQRLTLKQIGQKYGVTPEGISYWVKKYGIALISYEERHPNLPTIEEFLDLYNNQGMSLDMIAGHLSISRDVIVHFCEKYHIQLRPNGFNGGRRFECTDGHTVRSVYEQRVDNWLSEHQVEHVYEPPLPFDKRYRADFLVNGWYIEIWGIRTYPNNSKRHVRMSEKYVQRHLYKKQMYKEHHLPLLEIYEHDFDNRRNAWTRMLTSVLNPPPRF